MKKALILFIIFSIFIILAKTAYSKYCETKPEGCKKVKVEDQGLDGEGIDW